jgi:transposase
MSFRRFEMHQYRHVLSRMRLGDTDRSIARSGLMGRKKSAQFRQLALKHGWLDPETPLPDPAELARGMEARKNDPLQQSLVEPYTDEVTEWLKNGVQGTTIHQTLVRKYGFEGSYSSVRRFLAQVKDTHPDVTTILDFAPGEAAQVDFGSGPQIVDVFTGEVIKTWFFVMTLCFSRHQYAEIITNQKVDTWLACHRRAFEFFGGVPKKLIIDNAKCAITRACYHDPAVQRSYAGYAEGYGFMISPCPPRDPKKKGRVESGVKYVKRNFMPLREFRSLSDANEQLKQWVLEVAGNRIHGTTRQRPLTLFAETEKPFLRPLPDVPPQMATWTRVKVHGNCHVQFEKAYYSVPFRLVTQHLWLKATDNTVKLFRELGMVAVHPRLYKPGDHSTVDDHLPPEALAYKMQDPQWCLKQAKEIGTACHRVIQTLFKDRVLDNLRAAQGIIGLGKKYGPNRLETACQRALFFDNIRYRSIKAILCKGLDQLSLFEKSEKPLASTYTGSARFLRQGSDLHIY